MSSDEVLWWLPTAAVAAMTLIAFAAVVAQPARPSRVYWMAGVVLCGVAAIGISAWRQTIGWAALGDETARLREFGARLDELGRLLPPAPGGTAGETFDTATAAIRSLNAKVADLQGQIEASRQKNRARSIPDDVAMKMADYLRQFGSHRVVVSCAPDDVEAFNYANQIVNVLREAGWDASGPEKTTIFGEAPTMVVRLFVKGGTTAAPETANLLIDAFTRFNIPFESGLAASEAIPDAQTTELFVSRKP